MNLDAIDLASGWTPGARYRIWKPLMTANDARYGGSDFPQPDQSLIAAPQVSRRRSGDGGCDASSSLRRSRPE
ncbi:hypothetical protein [Rathayibacter rathayi]|uniref:hypothetical protein n=1 Tax=Rathayibacter rathayi TaxID=33887 RepID=UPI000CE916E0|nr:hypothetical protein [Rathayibacter rathayi]PPG66701.1 hypothetical protein C5C02_10815 [Rathayibacter rathayi]PPG74577.1 hypothetical protein C5C23_12730 [Rathayibacter rathayi]PPI76207.1 hypothetical protein C5E03_11070 [Rathayibacter rathayi]